MADVVADRYHALSALKRIAVRIPKQRRCLFTLSGGHLGTGPEEMREGDQVFRIAGIPTPMVLRSVEDQGDTYKVVGAALVHGVMHGEVFGGADTQKSVVLV